jgi:hypothetical protein
MRMLLDQAGLVVEPSAALGIAAVLEDRDRFAGRHVATIVCGSNVDADAYRRWTGADAVPVPEAVRHETPVTAGFVSLRARQSLLVHLGGRLGRRYGPFRHLLLRKSLPF